MNEDVLKKIEELIRTKKPLMGKDKFEIMVNTCVMYRGAFERL